MAQQAHDLVLSTHYLSCALDELSLISRFPLAKNPARAQEKSEVCRRATAANHGGTRNHTDRSARKMSRRHSGRRDSPCDRGYEGERRLDQVHPVAIACISAPSGDMPPLPVP